MPNAPNHPSSIDACAAQFQENPIVPDIPKRKSKATDARSMSMSTTSCFTLAWECLRRPLGGIGLALGVCNSQGSSPSDSFFQWFCATIAATAPAGNLGLHYGKAKAKA